MPTNVEFTPLYGLNDCSAVSYLLMLDGYRILLDCGWNSKYDLSLIQPLIDIAPTIDIVLLSYPDLAHLGALPYLIAKCGLKAPVYGTIPIYKFGQIFLYDSYESQKNQRDFDLFNLEEIDLSMQNFKQLTYSQRVRLQDKGLGIEFTPLSAGHMIGGSIWVITKHVERIIYAIDYNNRVEKHLNPCVLSNLAVSGDDISELGDNKYLDLNVLKSPTVLITDAWPSQNTNKHTETRNREFIQACVSTLREGGDVLIPCDSAGRVLELLLLLEDNWADRTQKIVFLTSTSFSTIEFCKTQLEWLEDTHLKRFCHDRVSSFYFKHIITLANLDDLESIPKPRVILASEITLTCGFALNLFPTIIQNKVNSILLTERAPEGTLSRELYDRTVSSHDTESELEIMQWHRVPLVGKELDLFLAKKKLAEEEKAAQQKKRFEELMLKAEVPEDVEGEDMDNVNNAHEFWKGFDLTSDGLSKLRARGLKPTFLYVEPKCAHDDYGEVSRLEGTSLIKMDVVSNPKIDDDLDYEDDDGHLPPSKAVYELTHYKISCKVKIFNFEGRTDLRFMKKILMQVAPQKLILVHGSPEGRNSLADYVKETIKSIVYVPEFGKTLNISSNVHFLDAHIKHQDFAHLRFVSSGDYELALVNGLLLPPSSSDNVYEVKVRDNLEANNQKRFSQNMILGMFVGDIQLKDVKADLDSLGYKTEWKGKMLQINGGIIQLKKEVIGKGISKLTMEGIMCDEYFEIRQTLYNRLIVL